MLVSGVQRREYFLFYTSMYFLLLGKHLAQSRHPINMGCVWKRYTYTMCDHLFRQEGDTGDGADGEDDGWSYLHPTISLGN